MLLGLTVMEVLGRLRLAELLQLLLLLSQAGQRATTRVHYTHRGRAFEGGEGEGGRGSWETPPSIGPVFDPSPPRNVTALRGDNAYLNCIVHHLGNRTVSWIREQDLHILTVAQYTYTADDRFEVIHSESTPNSWVLKIKSVQPRDSGRYECQVNTHPTDPITFPVYLAVFVPTANILGTSERYVYRGSTINLTCIINHNPESPTEIFWYHNNEVINYDNRDSRVSVITDRGPVTKTVLLIHDAHDGATGSYSCVPSPSATASVRIHILDGDSTAAILTNTGPLLGQPPYTQLASTFIALVTTILQNPTLYGHV